MANPMRKMKRLESKKSYSWWWDSHISPKNSKWLAENLEDMDQHIKRMMKLIEEEGDSFAKKAEMYYQKRPELVSHVEEFYRMYRALAERYDNLTGELRNSIPSNLKSQGSNVSDSGSDLTSPVPTLEKKASRRHRAAGFDFFLGSGGGSSDLSRKESDGTSSSSSGSDSESDAASSGDNFLHLSVNGDGEGLQRRITELEAELLEVKEKLRVTEEENSDALSTIVENGNYEELLGRITWYDEEVKVANERLKLSEEQIQSLKAELEAEKGRIVVLQEKITGLEADFSDSVNKIKALEDELRVTGSKLEIEKTKALSESSEVDDLEISIMDQEQRIIALEKELKISNDELHLSAEEIVRLKTELEKAEKLVSTTGSLQAQLESYQKEIKLKESELDMEKKGILDLQEQVAKLEESVSDRDHKIGELKITISEAEENSTLEKSQLHEKISVISESQFRLEAKIKDWELKAQSLEQELERVEAEKLENQHLDLIRENGMQSENEQLKAVITERSNQMEVLNKSFDELKVKYDMLMTERDELNANVLRLTAEVASRDDCIHQNDEHLQRLHLEHVELISGSEKAHKLVEELKTRVSTLEEEVERQRIVISDGAEQKREAIRQLCFSLEHYRDGYRQLRQAFLVHKRPAVLAA